MLVLQVKWCVAPKGKVGRADVNVALDCGLAQLQFEISQRAKHLCEALAVVANEPENVVHERVPVHTERGRFLAQRQNWAALCVPVLPNKALHDRFLPLNDLVIAEA